MLQLEVGEAAHRERGAVVTTQCVRTPTGWSPGRNTNETELQAAQRLLREYPGTTGVRKFFQNTAISSTSGALAANLAPGTRVTISVPGTVIPANLPTVVNELVARGLCVDVVMSHEPEKKVTPEAFLAAYTRLNELFPEEHPLRADGTLAVVAVMTVQRARIYAPEDLRRFITPALAKLLDLLCWDWYASYAPRAQVDHYEAPAEAFKLIVDFAAEIGVPGWGITEFNHERIMKANGFAVDLDPDGVMCAEWFGDMRRYAVDHGCLRWLHFHTGDGRLTAPGAERTPEYEVLKELVTLSSEVAPTPDPNHPQYVLGFEEGHRIGYDEGRAAGLTEGRTQGVVDGKRELADQVITYAASVRP